MSGKEPDFLSRWSARKRSAAKTTPDIEVEEAASPVVVPEDPPEMSPEEQAKADRNLLDTLGLKHPDDLRPGDDVKGFMQAAVPDRLRRLALRQLWRGNPVLANLDELVDYGQDFTDSAMVVENMQTLYQVGKGMMRKLETLAEDDEPTAGHPALSPGPKGDQDQPVDEDAPDRLAETAEPEPDIVRLEEDHAQDPPPTSRPRRMTFRYES
ncbi:MAG: DUF3306 domain-containing protein [Pseudomonadota bacterium]